jgi:hypothetical protein
VPDNSFNSEIKLHARGAGDKFPTQAETVFLLSLIRGDHWTHPHCLLMGIFATLSTTVPAGSGQAPLTQLCNCYYIITVQLSLITNVIFNKYFYAIQVFGRRRKTTYNLKSIMHLTKRICMMILPLVL